MFVMIKIYYNIIIWSNKKLCDLILENMYQNLAILIFTEKLQTDCDWIILKSNTQPGNEKLALSQNGTTNRQWHDYI